MHGLCSVEYPLLRPFPSCLAALFVLEVDLAVSLALPRRMRYEANHVSLWNSGHFAPKPKMRIIKILNF
jgi:hypothetical protein